MVSERLTARTLHNKACVQAPSTHATAKDRHGPLSPVGFLA
jgi:hypothetical protein